MNKCKPGEEISARTGKCIKNCKPFEERNPITGRCRKSKSNIKAICKSDEEISTRTGKCIKKCKSYQERNIETGRCRKKSAAKIKPLVIKPIAILTPIKSNTIVESETVIKKDHIYDNLKKIFLDKHKINFADFKGISTDILHDKIGLIEYTNQTEFHENYVKLLCPLYMAERGHGGLPEWTYEINRAFIKAGGKCSIRTKIIKIGTKTLLHNPITNIDDIRDTILHEIAHANAWYRHRVADHGELWRQEAIAIGCSGNAFMPPKYTQTIIKSVVYKCLHPGNKCTFYKLANDSINNILCDKHGRKYRKYAYLKTNYKSFGEYKSDLVSVVPDGSIVAEDLNNNEYLIDPGVRISVCDCGY